MTNSEFTDHIKRKLDDLLKAEPSERPADFQDQKKLLETALKIMTYGTGQERRRFRRDYERRLGHGK